MIRKFISLMMLGFLLLTCLTGCGELGQGMIKEFEDNKDGIRRELGELWDGFLDEFNDWTDSFATHSITKDSRLIGERKKGTDDYVGTYEADYDQFTGEEFIFGGTSLKRKEGSDLQATYSLTIQSALYGAAFFAIYLKYIPHTWGVVCFDKLLEKCSFC